MRTLKILLDRLKTRARSEGVSSSELTRNAMGKNAQKVPVTNARAYFERLKPLESFAHVDSEDYVRSIRSIRSKSRILRTGEDS